MVGLYWVSLRENEGDRFGIKECVLFLIIKRYWLVCNGFEKFKVK